ncbi:MAG: glycosyltransferase [Patescibacteria group bacterium]
MQKIAVKNNIIDCNSAIFFATFSHYEKGQRLPTNGMVEPMLSFFLPKVKTFLLLDGPHPVSDVVDPVVEAYRDGRLDKKFLLSPLFYLFAYFFCKIPSKAKTRISFKIRDFFSAFFLALMQKEKFDLFIGLEAVYALAGILLRKIGRIKRVVYYVSDYSPTRFGKNLFNTLYIWLDLFCVRHADFTWDVSAAMKEGRLRAGLKPSEATRIIHVPNGLFPAQIDPLPISQRVKDTLVYMGILDPDKGVDLALKALKLVIAKRPQTSLHIIGGTPEGITRLKQMAVRLGIERSIIFYGFVPPNKKMSSIINRCYLGLTTYSRRRSPENRYGDSGKIRQYLGCGLPIVSTKLQAYTKYVIDQGAGIGTKESVKDFANAILTLLKDDSLYRRCSVVATRLGRANTWENSYTQALFAMRGLIICRRPRGQKGLP